MASGLPLADTGRMPSMTEAQTRAKVPGSAYYLLFVITLILLFAMIDRLSLTLLVEPIKADLKLTDVQMSLLLGMAFALPFSAFGLPAGYLVDRFSRRTMMLVGGLAWSVTTIAAAFAPSFAWLFVCRAGLGLGEAILSPCAYSLIRDAFPARKHAMAFGLHNAGGPMGAGLTVLVVGHLAGIAGSDLPGLQGLSTWRAALVVVGVASLASVMMMLTVREPERRLDLRGVGKEEKVRAAWRHLGARWTVYVSLFAATGLFSIASLGIAAWLPTGLSRLFDQPIETVSRPLGLVQIFAPLAGILFAVGVLTGVLRRSSVQKVAFVGSAAMAVSAVALITSMLSPSRTASWCAIAVFAFLHPWSGVVVATMLAGITPSRMMGKVSAINFLMLGLVGMAGGPTLVPLVALLFHGPAAIAFGILVVAGAAYVSAAIALYVAGTCSRRSQMQTGA